MLRLALFFLLLSLVAGLMGFTGIAGTAAVLAKTLFFAFLMICLVLFALGASIAKGV